MNNKMSWEDAVKWLREQPGRQELVKACYFDDPIEVAAERYYSDEEWKNIRSLITGPKGKALDVGSGRGIAAYALARDGWDVTALEPDQSSLVGAQAIQTLSLKSNVMIKIVSEWGEKLPFENNHFEFIHARQVLHHAKNLKQFCSELFRVCKSGGQMIATREHVISKNEDLPAFLASHPLHHLYGGEHAYRLDEYLGALQEAGFIIEKVFSPFESPINYFPASKKDLSKQVIGRFVGGRIASKIPVNVPEWALNFFSKKFLNTPGRLYTFVARKP